MEKDRQSELKFWFKSAGVKWVLFDMDSTLVGTVEHYRIRMLRYCRYLAKESGGEEAEIFDLFMKGIISLRGEFQVQPAVLDVPARVLAKMCGVGGAELEEEMDKLMEIFELVPEVFPGAVEQVRLVRGAGVDTALVTHADSEWTWKKRREFRGLFKSCVCTPTDRPKDALAWKGALEELGLRPEEVMVIGDNWMSDIEPALEMGAKMIVWVRNGAEPRNDPRVIEIETIADLVTGILSS